MIESIKKRLRSHGVDGVFIESITSIHCFDIFALSKTNRLFDFVEDKLEILMEMKSNVDVF
jgi:hypothetical protein